MPIDKRTGRHLPLKSFLNRKCLHIDAESPCDYCIRSGLTCGPKSYTSPFISEQPVEKPVFLDSDSDSDMTGTPSSLPSKLWRRPPKLEFPQPTVTTSESITEAPDYARLVGESRFLFYSRRKDNEQKHWHTSEAQGNSIVTLSVTPLCISTSPLFTKIKNQSFAPFLPDGFDELDNLFENLEIAIGLDYLPDDIPFANPSDFKMEWFSGDTSQPPV